MKDLINQLKPELNDVFGHLHQIPEVGWQEHNTTAYIAEYLYKKGFRVRTFPDCTGLFVEVGEGDLCIAVRTDIDALWQEVDGEFKANHSCGHDAHMTMIIGTMLLMQKLGFPSGIRFKFIFQPAEEKGSGALKLIDLGIMDDVNFLYGVHLRPIQEMADGFASPAIYHGASRFIEGRIIGEDAHGARPHLGHNAIEIGAKFIQEIQGIHLDPMVPYSAKLTRFLAGGSSGNIIPGKAAFSIDVRAQNNQTIDALYSKIEAIADSLSRLHDVKILLEIMGNTAAARVCAAAKESMKSAIIDTIGKEKLIDPVVTSGGEDFHFYTLKRPDIQATMLGLGCGLTPGLHHPQMIFNREAMYTGIEILTKTVINTAKSHQVNAKKAR
ncbi:M20 peptidase aminoacylase family protein [Peribacillus psychrosaccharolyticus]|uniref:M20 peptidase aminoacylase family protein n=1 Tax=Peribacillus psychrosaccharolyticus TaxID=1407 RepID=A0A974S1Q5_PERPY|nr:M20 peptidase aminoacylase family protein [Peribacillus psychrosaccharolyticus]MEC2057486.1 M20 peptidase aminoacylase family protein [Peribacillus psychrosaccharolyticus]MED3745941.1 M20 peptidase aminoacylase family protein [Peribacillus psychrosaccharolyticus]QQT01794.1 M20 peptidase aminoacylase family protein [Peribacillus psychrosaccharolyticus]